MEDEKTEHFVLEILTTPLRTEDVVEHFGEKFKNLRVQSQVHRRVQDLLLKRLTDPVGVQEGIRHNDVVNGVRLVLESGHRLLAGAAVASRLAELFDALLDQLGHVDRLRVAAASLVVNKEQEVPQIFGDPGPLDQLLFVESGKFSEVDRERFFENVSHQFFDSKLHFVPRHRLKDRGLSNDRNSVEEGL